MKFEVLINISDQNSFNFGSEMCFVTSEGFDCLSHESKQENPRTWQVFIQDRGRSSHWNSLKGLLGSIIINMGEITPHTVLV